MSYNKQYIQNEDQAIVRIFSNHYSHSVSFVNELVTEAKNDFGLLAEDDIKVVMLAGSRYNRMTAIQFVVSLEDVPSDYFEWTRTDDLGFCQTY